MRRWIRLTVILSFILPFTITFTLSPTSGALWDKRYVVKRDQGKDILCDPYIVQENDWIYKIFREKGEISEQDLPAFFRIFKRLNPQVADINRIYPGNLILIPLKIITEDTLPTRPSGSVIIPFASISDRPFETIFIRRGDSVSKLIAQHFGNFGSREYQEGLHRFQELNPQINDLNVIMVGQKVHLPLPSRSNSESAPIVASESKTPEETASRPEIKARKETVKNEAELAPSGDSQAPPKGIADTLKKVAVSLDAELYNKGSYFFPMMAEEDWRLDLGLFPVMLLKDQTRILFIRPYAKVSTDFNIVQSHWKNVRIVRIPAPPVSTYQLLDRVSAKFYENLPREKLVFTDGDVTVEIHAKWMLTLKNKPAKPHQHICLSPVNAKTEPFPESIFRYLAKQHITYREIMPDGQINAVVSRNDHNQTTKSAQQISTVNSKRFIQDLAAALGWVYKANVEISFPYAGIHVNAFSNMLSIDSEHACLVDFGNFAGDSISAIESTGVKVASVKNHFDSMELLHYLFEKLSVVYTDKPTIAVRDQQNGQGVFFTYPGLTAHSPGGQALITSASISDEQTIFLATRGIQIVRIVP